MKKVGDLLTALGAVGFIAVVLELLQEQPVSEITPGKICDRAGVNRSTFYRHYRSTTQLKAEIESRILEHVDWLGGILDSENRREKLLPLFLFSLHLLPDRWHTGLSPLFFSKRGYHFIGFKRIFFRHV